ncbi:MAG: hypothetical protein ACJ8AI_34570 [Rhodopila sp.]
MIESRPGAGTTISTWLPQEASHDAAGAVQQPISTAGMAMANGGCD